jgi:hypothetical protein
MTFGRWYCIHNQNYHSSGGVFKVLISLNNVLGFIVIASQQIITVFVVKFAGGVTFCDFLCFCNAFPLGVNLGKTLSYLIEHVA